MSERNDIDVDKALDAWTPMEPPADFVDRVLAARTLQPEVTRAKRSWWLAAPIAAVAMIALVLFFATQNKMDSAPAAKGNTDVVTMETANNGSPAPNIADTSPSYGSGAGSSTGSGSAAVAMNQPVFADAGVVQTQNTTDPEALEPAIRAGESVVIHAAESRVTVQIVLGDHCAGTTLVTIRQGATTAHQTRGVLRANITLPLGTWSYTAVCEATQYPDGKGTIVVIEDEARRPIPKATPARNDIGADGRTWRISYQTVIPDVRVKMPAGATKLVIAPPANALAIEVAVKGGYALIPSGKLGDGVFTLSTTPPSKATTLIIDFDNTAPQIYIADVKSGPQGGSSMVVSGATQPGWKLQIRGTNVPLDARFRFKTITHGFDRIVIRAEHPQRGIHFFVSRIFTF